MSITLETHSLTRSRWPDFETLFGPRGACAGCWCMWWRLKRSEWEKKKGEANKQALHAIVSSGEIPGILGYAHGRPIAWCAVAPREQYPVLQRSRILKPIDEREVWSVTCFFVARSVRRQGVSLPLLRAALDFAQAKGARIVEGYPIDTDKPDYPPAFANTGFYTTFKAADFVECARRSQTRPIMRYTLE